MSDLVFLLNSLVDSRENMVIEGIYDSVDPVTRDELSLYEEIDFDPNDFKKDIGVSKLLHENDKVKTLMSRWRFPSLSIHGIQGAFSEGGAKTVIPRKVIGKFSIRIVPSMQPEKVGELVIAHLNKKWAERGSPNKMKAQLVSKGRPWLSNIHDPNYQAGRAAIKEIYDIEPDFTREGGSIPITLSLQEVTQKSVILLPMGASDDGAHSQNEKIDVFFSIIISS